MPMSSESPLRIPIIDLSRLDLANPHGQEWETVSAQVMSALKSIGCFEAVFDRVSPEDLEAIFDIAAKDLFTLPLNIKMKNTSNKARYGYLSDRGTKESFGIDRVNTVEGRDAFAQLMWPEGNPTFCKTVEIFGKHLPELSQMIARMVLEKLGIQNYFSSYTDSSSYTMRVWKYTTQEPDVVLPSHVDTNLLSIICQNRVAGLELQTRNGDWIPVVPSTCKFVVVIGECFKVLSNGRLEAPLHRVKLDTTDTRYSLIFDTYPRDGCTVETPKEMVDEEHPLLFKPFKYGDYMRWRMSEEGKLPRLKKYCGIIRGSGEEV